VRREVPGVDHERVAGRGEVADVVVGALLDHRGDVAVGVALRVTVPGHGEVDVVVDAAGEGVPAGPARGSYVAGPVAVEELADEARAVAGVAEPRARLVGRVEGLEPAVDAAVVLDAVVLGVLAGGQLGARRAAQRVRRDGVGELHPLVGEQAARDRHVVEVVVAHVVGEDEDDVGARRLRVGGAGRVLRGLDEADRVGRRAVTVGGHRREGGDEHDQQSSRDRPGQPTHLRHSFARNPEGARLRPRCRGKTRALGRPFPKRHDDWGEPWPSR